MITPEEIVGEEWGSWYRLSPQERWRESKKLWQVYYYLGGSFEEPDTQSPFFDPDASSTSAAYGRPGMRTTAQPSLALRDTRKRRKILFGDESRLDDKNAWRCPFCKTLDTA